MHKLSSICLFLALLACELTEPCFGLLRKRYVRSVEDANVDVNVAEQNSTAEALFLTPYIEAGKLVEGRKLSEVKDLPLIGEHQDIKSYSGYLTVNKEHNSNIFFWFFPPLVNSKFYAKP